MVYKAKCNDVSLPLKIFFYLSNGLKIIYVRIKSVENTKIADFYNEDSSKRVAEIAKVIKK